MVAAKPTALFSEQTVMPLHTEEQVVQQVQAMATMKVEPERAYAHERFSERGNGNGNGNGNGSSRNRTPLFSEEDRTIPAYIRRLEDN
jgi:hypothetical protein